MLVVFLLFTGFFKNAYGLLFSKFEPFYMHVQTHVSSINSIDFCQLIDFEKNWHARAQRVKSTYSHNERLTKIKICNTAN